MKFWNPFLSARPLKSFETAYALLRILTGALVLYHGLEVFDAKIMGDYVKWLTDLKFPAPGFMAYLGKSGELIAGIGILTGLLTRFTAVPLIIAMLVVCFGMGQGKFWYEDQHPFLFAILGVLFVFGGGGKWSLDAILFDKK